MSDLKNAHRIYTNIAVLLAEHPFPGKLATVIAEAHQFLHGIITKLEGELSSVEQQEATVAGDTKAASDVQPGNR